jgi:hypothetical protein
MKLRRKSAPDTLRPLLKELQKVIRLAVPTLTTQEGRAIISGIAVLCRKIAKWAETVAGGEHEDARLSEVGSSPMLALCSMTSIKIQGNPQRLAEPGYHHMWTLYMRFYIAAYLRVLLSSAGYTFVTAIWMGGR